VKKKGFFAGLSDFSKAFTLCMNRKELYPWYKKVSLRAFALAFVVLIVLLFLGGFGIKAAISAWVAQTMWADITMYFLTILWIIAVFWFSGTITTSLMMLFVGALLDEEKLIAKLKNCDRHHIKKAKWKDVRLEIWVVLRSILIAIFTFPLFLIPFLIPLAILINAWAMGWEALKFGQKLIHQAGEQTFEEENQSYGGFYAMGLGVMASGLLIIPILGWATIPILQVSGVIAQDPKNN